MWSVQPFVCRSVGLSVRASEDVQLFSGIMDRVDTATTMRRGDVRRTAELGTSLIDRQRRDVVCLSI